MDEYVNEVAYPMKFVEYVDYYELVRAYESQFQAYDLNVKWQTSFRK